MSSGNGKKKASRSGFVYRSYSFKDKDPVIDRLRSLVQKEGLSYGEVHVISGVSDTTLRNWFEGETRRPQYATVAAVTSSLGYTTKFVRARNVNFEREIEKAKEEITASAAKSG
jgi:transcriptional regulator with XRE-family HTH domain